jgi:hypothetical protein
MCVLGRGAQGAMEWACAAACLKSSLPPPPSRGSLTLPKHAREEIPSNNRLRPPLPHTITPTQQGQRPAPCFHDTKRHVRRLPHLLAHHRG